MIPPRKGIRGDNSELVSDFWIIRVVDTNLSTRICPRIGTNILPHLKYVHKILAVTRLETALDDDEVVSLLPCFGGLQTKCRGQVKLPVELVRSRCFFPFHVALVDVFGVLSTDHEVFVFIRNCHFVEFVEKKVVPRKVDNGFANHLLK